MESIDSIETYAYEMNKNISIQIKYNKIIKQNKNT